MATFLFENNTPSEVCIEIIKCPVGYDCEQEFTGDGRYNTFIVPPNGSVMQETDCDSICWKHCSSESYTRASDSVILV